MEQLTTYRVKHKLNGLVFLFKYDLNGDYRSNEICEGVLTPQQIKWLFTGYLPKGTNYANEKELLSKLQENFPASEEIMKTVWMKDERYTKQFDVEVSPADLSFDALWNLYGGGSGKQDAIKAYKKLKPAELIKCFIEIPYYFQQLKSTPGIAKLYLASYINKKRYEDDRPQVAMKVGKVFNPMLKDLATKKTNKS